MNTQTVYINARFLTQHITGVQRYGIELVQAIDSLIDTDEPEVQGLAFELVAPSSGILHELRLKHIPLKQTGVLGGHPWEQLELPRDTARGVLFCPGNTAPMYHLSGNRRCVVTLHSLAYHFAPEAYTLAFRKVYSFLIPRICRRAKAVITVSESEASLIRQTIPAIDNRLKVVAHGGPGKDFVESLNGAGEQPITSSVPRILYVGSLNPCKNPQAVFAAFAQLRKEVDAKLVVVGENSGLFEQLNLDIDNDVDNHIEYLGQIDSSTKLLEQYRAASMLVFPSFYESFGMPPIEAMLCRCPVLASDIPALRETCGDAALYSDPNNIDDIKNKMLQILQDRELTQQLRSRGSQQIEKFSWKKCAQETVRIIREEAMIT